MGRLERATQLASYAVVTIALVIWCLLLTADSSRLGTLLAFGPQWVLLVPIALLAATAAVLSRQSLVPLTLAAGLVVGPVMGLNVPWRATKTHGGAKTALKLITCNTLFGAADERLSEFIAREAPDVVVLQEWPSQRAVPTGLAGWQIVRSGNLLVASRWPIAGSESISSPASQWLKSGLRCRLVTPDGPADLFCVHLLTPRAGLEAVLGRWSGGLQKLGENTRQRALDARAVSDWIDSFPGPRLVAGDFNLTPTSVIYRQRFSHLQNAFSTAGWGWGNTKFTRLHGVRIDHVLADDSWQVLQCEVGPDVGSDHRPVVAQLRLVDGAGSTHTSAQ